MKSYCTVLSFLAIVSFTHAFFQKAPAKAAKPLLADEAVALFDKNFPFGREPVKASPFTSLGVPMSETNRKKYDTAGKRFTDISEQDARAAFAELSKACGSEENALAMTKTQPLCLAYNKKWFVATLNAYSGVFGEEEAVAMVVRNPGLMAVKPEEAANANDQTMQASYLISTTRPVGAILLATILGLVLVPAIEGFTGISISLANKGL